ncbi:anthranilate synthase component I [Calothrix sp. 336/3]|uniref:anthranilate synthase component I n=1 Tax=Calothrix sp. 336/3 TaxID=1337936 RepID=UPI0004E32598|nr:anthranilate synthase component I [Calothrix sp. 336/3]AKG22257.1 hypothetical protein IJ00_14190 [Calothrix sp. 336/3]
MIQPWEWRSLPLHHRTASEIFASLFLHNPDSKGIATLLESPESPENPQLARYSLCAGSPRIINGIAQMWTPSPGTVLPFLENLLQQTTPQENIPHHLPFTGGWLGWLGYDVAWEIEKLPYTKSDTLPFPLGFWYEPESFAVLDHHQQILWLAASNPSALDELTNKLQNSQAITNTPPSPYSSTPHFTSSRQEYQAAVEQAKKYIQAGDIFQTNLSLRFSVQTHTSGWEIYRALHKINPSPFACYWQTPWGEVISCSPERLVLLEGNQAETRPIAGTRSRGKTPEADTQLAADLLTNTKERAEHIMLVDLERNDLGRVCQWGSVNVDELLTIERYSHVMHLVSNVKGTLKSELSAIDLIRAMFPGGTITGCPKVRCMEIIEELEPVRRSLFYGSCGYLDWRGNLDLNILIRTLLLVRCEEETELANSSPPPNTVWGQVGAGIVADSDPEREWQESLQKAQAQIQAISLQFNSPNV